MSRVGLGGVLHGAHGQFSSVIRFCGAGESTPAGSAFQRDRTSDGSLDPSANPGSVPEDTAPRYLVRDRDQTYEECFRHRLSDLVTTEVLTGPQSPWRNPFAERLVGCIRRECVDHVTVLGEKHLRRILKSYFDYYLRLRTHLSLAKDAPTTRFVQGPEAGQIVEIPQVGGPHHRYERRAV
jgi:hypothetical protein